MKLIIPELLLFFLFLLPPKNTLVAQVLLCQIRSIHAAHQAEKKLDVDLDNDTDEALREFLVSLWFDPGNATAYAYLGLLAPDLGLLNHPVIRKGRSSKAEGRG